MRPAPALAAAAFLAGGASVAFAQALPQFRSDVGVAYVDVFVSDDERPVHGLRGPDFELRDDGVPQRVELAEIDAMPVQVLLLFDSSNSLTGEKRAALQVAGDLLLAALRPVDEVGLIAFSDDIRWLARPTVDRRAVHDAIASLQPVGATAVYDALAAALAVADPRGRTLIILFTDEVDNSSLLDATDLRAAAERSSALVHLVTVRKRGAFVPNARVQPESHPLQEIAELTGGRAWIADSVATLTKAFTRIAATFATRYVLRYEPAGEPKPGWHRLEVRLKKGKARLQSRRGYWVPQPPDAAR